MTPLRWFLLLLSTAAVAVFCWGHAEARADPIVRTARIGFRDWPKGRAPVRVLLASDIHLGNLAMDPARLHRIVGQIDALSPDAILLAGDFVAGYDKAVARKASADMVAPLARLHAPFGVIAVLGNHDEATEPEVIRRALRRAGVRVLDNDAVPVGPLAVLGFEDLQTGPQRLEPMLTKARALHGLPIALTHGDNRDYLLGKVRLLLVGHTHCAQIALERFGIRNPYFSSRYRCGLVRDRFGVTLTTAGLGTSVVPLRYNAPPDLWVLTLGPAETER